MDILEKTEEQTEPVQEPEGKSEGKPEGRPEGKLFTQEEVNNIVSERLRRAKAREEKQEAEDTRSDELDKRERRLDCREYLASKDYPPELLDAINATDLEDFKKKADMIVRTVGESTIQKVAQGRRVPPLRSTEPESFDSYAEGFSQKRHTPKPYYVQSEEE